jgi:hypothetical protein
MSARHCVIQSSTTALPKMLSHSLTLLAPSGWTKAADWVLISPGESARMKSAK